MTRRLTSLYLLVGGVIVILGATHFYRDSLQEAKHMSTNWVILKDNVKVEARPAGLWTVALEWLDGPAILKFEAGDEEWFYSESDVSKTRADGHLTSLLAAKGCLLQSAPVGALIGKIGGSSASATDGTLFTVGKFTLLEIDKSKGPLYLTINDEPGGFANNRGAITVKISSRSAPVLTTATPKPGS